MAEKTVGPSQKPGTKTRVGLVIGKWLGMNSLSLVREEKMQEMGLKDLI